MPFLELTDGISTVTLTNGTTSALQEGGWAPRVAPLNRATLGGGGPFADVEEQIAVNQWGAAGDTALYQRLQAVQALMLQAERWAEGGADAPAVRLRYQPDGSALPAPLECAVLGNPDAGLELPGSFNDMLMVREIEGAGVRFRRRGLWLGAEDTAIPVAGVAGPSVALCGFAGALPYPSPTWVEAGNFPAWTKAYKDGYQPGMFLIGDGFATIQTRGPSALTTEALSGGAWSTLSESTSGAHEGTVLRFTASGGPAEARVITDGVAASMVGVYLAVRNTSLLPAEVRMTVTAAGLPAAVSAAYTTDWVSIPATTAATPAGTVAQPFIVTMPPAPMPATPATGCQLSFTFRTSQPKQVLDLNYVVVTDAARTSAVVHGARAPLPVADLRVRADPRPLEQPAGDVRIRRVDTGEYARLPTRGAVAAHTTSGTINVAYLAMEPSAWAIRNPVTDATWGFTVRAGRRRGYLVPE